jgi:hypothetical protein
MSDTYGLKSRDRAIRSQMFRTLRHQHQRQSADGPRKYIGICSAENVAIQSQVFRAFQE